MQLSPAAGPTGAGSAPGLAMALAAAAATALGAPALAMAPPDQGEVGLRQMHYVDSQPGLRRITVRAWALDAVVPVGERWVAEAYAVVDAISGASPAYYTAPSSMTPLTDRRRAWDVRISRQWNRDKVTLGAARSGESDYVSAARSLLYSMSSDDQNRTWTFGLSRSDDRIDPVTRSVVGARKTTHEALLGWTQVVSPVDLVQLQITNADGRGYFSDPYKLFDKRPTERRQTAVLARWNHHFEPLGASARLSARAYRDSFDIRSVTLAADWAQALPFGWTLTPGLRLYAQTPAQFFSPPNPERPDAPSLPPGYEFGRSMISMDQRLAGLGARTVALKVDKRLASGHTFTLKVEHYEQRTGWAALGGGGSALQDFRARTVQVGYTHRWNR